MVRVCSRRLCLVAETPSARGFPAGGAKGRGRKKEGGGEGEGGERMETRSRRRRRRRRRRHAASKESQGDAIFPAPTDGWMDVYGRMDGRMDGRTGGASERASERTDGRAPTSSTIRERERAWQRWQRGTGEDLYPDSTRFGSATLAVSSPRDHMTRATRSSIYSLFGGHRTDFVRCVSVSGRAALSSPIAEA